MEDIIISQRILRELAIQKGITEDQLRAWIQGNIDTIVLVRQYITGVGVTTPTAIEASADPAGPLNATTVGNILELLEIVNMVTRIQRA